MTPSQTSKPQAVQDAIIRTHFNKALEGDTEAYWELVEPYGGLIFSVALGIVNDADLAHDLLHDVYLRAFSSLSNLRDPKRISSWLYSMTRNLCMDHLRRQARADKNKRDVVQRRTSVIPFYEVMIKKEEMKRLQAALKSLPEPFRVALGMKYAGGLKCREIANVLEISVSAVKSRLFEARRLLASRMKELEKTPDAAINGGSQS